MVLAKVVCADPPAAFVLWPGMGGAPCKYLSSDQNLQFGGCCEPHSEDREPRPGGALG